MWFEIYNEDHALEMVFTRKKTRVDANPESPPITQTEINIRDVRTPIRKVFTQEHNELFFNKLFDTLNVWRVNICIIMFFVWMSLQQRMI